jgi:hypothetical protein
VPLVGVEWLLSAESFELAQAGSAAISAAHPSPAQRRPATRQIVSAHWQPADRPGYNSHMPKPRSFTPHAVAAIVDAVRAGNYANVAAAAAGIHRSTYFAWMSRGEAASEAIARGDPVGAEEEPFADFHSRVRQAEAEAEMAAVASVREAKGGWQAHMTYLERRFHERWRRMDGIKNGRDRGETTPSMEAEIERVEEEHRRAGRPA